MPKVTQLASGRVRVQIPSSPTPDPKLSIAQQLKTTQILHHKMKTSVLKFSRNIGWIQNANTIFSQNKIIPHEALHK